MKKLITAGLFIATFIVASCGPKCKKCAAEVMGLKGPAQELCGEDLKRAEKTPGVTCK